MSDDRTQQLIDAISSPVRREILWLVWDQELSAGEIAAAFPLRGPTISSHLGVLRRAGLVTMSRQGTFRRYRARVDELQRLRSLLAGSDRKWVSSGQPDARARGRTVAAVVVEARVPCPPADSFRAFTDPAIYSRWVGVPVSIVDGRFTLTMPWGLRVRGTYDHQVAPSLIVMRWDFDRDEVPLPGDGLRAYLEIEPDGAGSAVAVTQLVRSDDESRFMERAWGLILARFQDSVVGVPADGDRPPS